MVLFLFSLLVLILLGIVVAFGLIFTRLRTIEKDLEKLKDTPGSAVPAVQPTRHPSLRPEPGPRLTVKQPGPVPVPELKPVTSLPKTAKPSTPSRSKEEWEAFVGGKLLNRIGALALIIGIGFFLKYAFDNQWISETVRVLIGVAIGGLLIAEAARTRDKGFQVFSQGLVGAGISILYLSVYASFNFYRLVPQLAAFLCMTVVTVIAFYHAARYGSRAIAVLGWLGGFLTPFLLSTGESNELGLFTYVALLDAGILLFAFRKDVWAWLEPLALAGTWLIYIAWFQTYYRPEDFALTGYFVIVFWGLFHVIGVVRLLGSGKEIPVIHLISSALNALFSFLAVFALLDRDHHDWLGGAVVLLGGLYLLSAALVHRKTPARHPWTVFFTIVGVLLVIQATADQWTGFTRLTIWSAEAFVLALTGSLWKRVHISWLSFGLFCVTGLALLFTPGAIILFTDEKLSPFFNQRALSFLVFAIASWGSGTLSAHLKGDSARTFSATLTSAALASILVFLSIETRAYFLHALSLADREARSGVIYAGWMTITAVWASYGTVLMWLAKAKVSGPAKIVGYISFILGLVTGVFAGSNYVPLIAYTPISNIRFFSLAIVILEGLFLLPGTQGKEGSQLPDKLVRVLRGGSLFLLLLLVSAETRDFFEREIALLASGAAEVNQDASVLENLEQLFLSGIWLIFSFIVLGVGIWKRIRPLRIAAIGVFGFTILKIFIYDLSFLSRLYRIGSFVILGIVLLGVSYAYQRFKNVIFGTGEDLVNEPRHPDV
jgi:uncharacterized membrane protein